MFTIEKTEQFDEWLKSLKNPIAKKAVISRCCDLKWGILAILIMLARCF